MLFSSFKLIHITCAFLSIAGFALRGYWMAVDSPQLQRRRAKVLPHVIDSLLLGSAIAMLLVWRVSPLQLDWLSAKIVALLLYIGFGMVALRFGKSRKVKVVAFLLALLVAGYIISVAYTKSPLGLLHLVFI